jgi:ATP-dependent Lon protease
MDEVLRHALVRMPDPIVWDEADEAAAAKVATPDDGSALVAH